jgi:hypothetical protein
MTDIPVLVVTYKRPEKTERLLKTLSQFGVKKIYISVDGPKLTNRNDITLVEATREVVKKYSNDFKQYNFQFHDKNLGLRKNMVCSINWAFSSEEKLIILEDDCLPSRKFLNFCEEMLKKYDSQENVMHISGHTLIQESKELANHRLSNIHHVWGWATWKKSWEKYTDNEISWSLLSHSFLLLRKFHSLGITLWFLRYLREASYDNQGVWSTNWSYAIFLNSSVSVSPSANLVENIGLREIGVHEVKKEPILERKVLNPSSRNSRKLSSNRAMRKLDKFEFREIRKLDANWTFKKNLFFLVDITLIDFIRKLFKNWNKSI